MCIVQVTYIIMRNEIFQKGGNLFGKNHICEKLDDDWGRGTLGVSDEL